ncbi:uncharacterized protein K452DRAFT_230259 [Aplosporella prunicola CBS 121167]|uniref:Uncharacterized protein n=1 Tax=Aplosporella prunicola CBS 121167 TaxID=1176127 RepID=A0A6A6BE49_9PEZI|nr:uncharacterized protein K452DRAFT_230259 [Aplosporella prunicola CBS 121167]KAF2140761.1 hypothetical protein K452DRAFT_230259 [Aplosporella prunicola CBS 121167]
MSSSTATPADLALSIAQTSANPPTLSIKLTNTHASAPLTLLTWDSPLDPQALALGLVHIAPAASEGDEPFKLPTIKVSRKLPPRREDLITLAPGQSRAQEIEFKEPVVPLGKIREKGGKAKVWVMGNWRALWAKTVEQVGDEELEAMEAAKDGMTGAFESEGVLVEV